MTLQQLYDRGYALGTGAHLRLLETGVEYILANVGDYMQCAVSLKDGNRYRDASPFNCAFQMNNESICAACGNLDDWEVVV